MVQPNVTYGIGMGTEQYNDCIALLFLGWGGSVVDDGNWPGDTIDPEAADPDPLWDSVETAPPSHMIVAEVDKPATIRDHPLLQCFATGYWGAPSAMISVDGQWYLRRFAPDSRFAKRFPQGGTKV